MSDTTITLTDDNKVEVLTSTLTTTGTLSYADFSSTISDKSTIKGVAIGNGVTQIADDTFIQCENLETLTFKEISSLTTIGNDAFLGCSKLSSSLTIPNSVTTIGTYAFSSCAKLEKVTMGNGVTNIGASAFSYCVKLATLDLGAPEKTIGANAFAYCYLLTELTIPNSVKNGALNANAFADSSIATLNLGKSNQLGTSNNAQSATDSSEFFGKTNIKVIIIPIFTSIPISSAEQGVVYNYQITAEDVNGGSLNATGTTIPSWLSFNTTTNVLSGRPLNANVGTTGNAVVLEVSDGELTTTQEFTITVSATAPFKTKTALETAIDKWYALANDGSATAVTKANNYDGEEYYGNPNTWDVSSITDLDFLFYGKTQDNHPDISTWNVFNVTSMQGTFSNSTFNGQLNKWNVENVTDFSYCFANNVVFNQPLFRWNTQDARTLKYMFYNAWSFNQSITRTLQYNDTDKGQIPLKKTEPLPSEEGEDWTVEKIKTYFTNIYGGATPQKDPTTFRGLFGMWALFFKITTKDKDTYPSITNDDKFKKLLGSIANSVLLLKSNKNNQYCSQYNKLVSITNAMLQINKANDYIQGSNLGYVYKATSKDLYTQMRSDIPFYLAWNWSKATTIAHMKHNALTLINGNTGTVNTTLSEEIAKNPVKTLMENKYSEKTTTNIEDLGQTLDNNLKETLNTVSNSNSALTSRAAAVSTKKDSAPPSFKDVTINDSGTASVYYITKATQEVNGDTTIEFSASDDSDNGITVTTTMEMDVCGNTADMSYSSMNLGVANTMSGEDLGIGNEEATGPSEESIDPNQLDAASVTNANFAFATDPEFGTLSSAQTEDQIAQQATLGIRLSGINVESFDPNAAELTAISMLDDNPTTGTNPGLDAAKILQLNVGHSLTEVYENASGGSIMEGIESIMESGVGEPVSVSFGGATVSLDNGNTQTYTNGQTTSVYTDESVVKYTVGSMTFSYSQNWDEIGETGEEEDQYTIAYDMGLGSMTLGAMLNEGSSTTTEFKKTEDYAGLSLSVDF